MNKNLANLPAAVATIPTGPSLAGLKKAMQNGDAATKYPVGTEIPDQWDGNDNPLVVAQYLDSTNNSAYGGAVGVILVRKFVEPISQAFSGSDVNYSSSAIKGILDTTYLDKCSDTLKSLISEINIPYYNGSSTAAVASRFFPMSTYEVCGAGFDNATEGLMWNYWKQKTGLSSLSNSNNSGRIVKDRNGAAQTVWLRSRHYSQYVCAVNANGSIGYSTPNYGFGVLPACFIAKD